LKENIESLKRNDAIKFVNRIENRCSGLRVKVYT